MNRINRTAVWESDDTRQIFIKFITVVEDDIPRGKFNEDFLINYHRRFLDSIN